MVPGKTASAPAPRKERERERADAIAHVKAFNKGGRVSCVLTHPQPFISLSTLLKPLFFLSLPSYITLSILKSLFSLSHSLLLIRT